MDELTHLEWVAVQEQLRFIIMAYFVAGSTIGVIQGLSCDEEKLKYGCIIISINITAALAACFILNYIYG